MVELRHGWKDRFPAPVGDAPEQGVDPVERAPGCVEPEGDAIQLEEKRGKHAGEVRLLAAVWRMVRHWGGFQHRNPPVASVG